MKEKHKSLRHYLRKFFNRLKIRQKLILFFLPVPLLAVILVGTLWYWNARNAVRNSLEEQTTVLAKNASFLIEDYIKERKLEIGSLTKLNWIVNFFTWTAKDRQHITNAKYQEQLKELLVSLDGGYSQVTCFDSERKPLCKVQLTSFLSKNKPPVYFETGLFDTLDRIAVDETSSLKENEIYISRLKSIHGSTAIVFGTAIFDFESEKQIGMMTFVFPLSRISERVIKNYSLGVTRQALIIDQTGQIIYHTDRKKINQTLLTAMPYLENSSEKILDMNSTTINYSDTENEAWILSAAPVTELKWVIGISSPVKPFIHSTEQAGLIGIILTIIISIFLLLLIYFLSKHFVRDLAEVTTGAKNIAAGNLEHQLPIRSQDEIGELAQSFNEMTRDLKRMIQEVDIHKNLAAIGQFAAGMYHDIKSPLEGLKMLVAGLKRKTKPESPLTPYVDEINIGIENLDRLIHETLDFVKPKSLARRPTDLNQFLQSAISELNVNGIEIEWLLDKNISEIEIDPVQLRHAIVNILNNAIDAMSNKGLLSIRTTADLNFVEVQIHDSGSGINTEDLGKVFQPFFSTKKSGSGLGLAVTHQIVRNHGGDIRIKSTEGKGTGVIIKLPMSGNKK